MAWVFLSRRGGGQDVFGLGFCFAGPLADGVNTRFGPQQAPAWWLLAYKRRIFVDGAADASGHHTMMSTLVAFGISASATRRPRASTPAGLANRRYSPRAATGRNR